MTWLLINDSDNSIAAGPLDAEPTPGEDQRVVVVALGYPDTCLWSQAKGGFVDIVVATNPLMSVGRFMLLFTGAERVAIRSAAAQSPQVEDFLDLLRGFTNGVSLTDPFMVSAIGELQAALLLTADRAAAVLAGTAPA